MHESWFSLRCGSFGGFNFVVFDIRWIQLPVCLFAFFVVDLWLSLHSVVVDLNVGCDNRVACVWRLLFIGEGKRRCVNSQLACQKVKLSVTWSCLPLQSSGLQWTWAMENCRDFVATIAFANYKLVILSLSTWCLGVGGSTHRNPVHCFLNSQALRWWRQQWLTSVLLKRLLCRVLATTIQDEHKESTKGVATRPAACQGELLSTTSRPTRRKTM